VLPIVLLSVESIRSHPDRLYWCAAVVAEFIVNRLNVSINALQTAMGAHYVLRWTELASSVLVIAAAVMAFRYAVIYLDILSASGCTTSTRIPEGALCDR
jgi:hypothetical protein